MALVQDLITLALKDAGILGVGQTPLAEDTNDAYTRLNQMLALWARQQFFVWHLNEYIFQATTATSYTVGPGGNFNVPYIPNKIDSAFARQLVTAAPNQIDYPLRIIMSRDEYNRIALKQLSSFPRYAYYDYAFETGFGVLYPWPLPQANIYEIHIFCKEQIQQFTSLTQNVNFPPEYQALITLTLARRLRVAYQLPPDMELNDMCDEATSIIKAANMEIPTLEIPIELIRGGIWDFYSDQVY